MIRRSAPRRTALVGLAVVLATAAAGPRAAPPLVDELVADGLDLAATLAVAPDGRIFVAERLAGRIRVVEHGRLRDEPYFTFDDVFVPLEENARGTFEPVGGYHGGLLGLAFDPQFAKVPAVYAFYTARQGAGTGVNRIVRLEGRTRGRAPRVVLDGIPGSRDHQSGRLAVGVDDRLYVTVGDLGRPELAQDPASLGGKILRLDLDGAPPPDNPFVGRAGLRPEIFALGIRSGFGLAVDPATGAVFESENGATSKDEINRVRPGANLGYPLCRGVCGRSDLDDPIHVWEAVIVPTGLVVYDGDALGPDAEGDLFVGSWLAGRIDRIELAADRRTVSRVEAFFDAGGPVYDVAVGRDGDLYYLTSRDLDAGASELRRLRVDGGGAPRLAVTGNSRPGGLVSLGVVGPPDAAVEHWYAFARREEPLATPEGPLWLAEPTTRVRLGRTGPDGRLTFVFPLPRWTAGVTIYHQALVRGGGTSRLTPLVAEPVYPPAAGGTN